MAISHRMEGYADGRPKTPLAWTKWLRSLSLL
jgi:hypothetical protein